MSVPHVKQYFEAMNGKQIDKLAEHLSDDILLLSPVLPEPFQGKQAVVEVLSGLLNTIDSLDVDLTFSSGQDVAVFFTVVCGEITVKGNEHIHVDEQGRIDLIEVAWRPLGQAVLIQEKLAKKLGGVPLRLVAADGASG
jgi:ketosteroid isomerase-like protein